jgi:hypothetical protein
LSKKLKSHLVFSLRPWHVVVQMIHAVCLAHQRLDVV